MTYRMIYTSEAVHQLSNDELKEILFTSRRNNEPNQITGSLVYVDGIFLQILEGDKAAVHTLAQRIQSDTRHRSFHIIYESETKERLFGSWSMACIRPSAREMSEWTKLQGTSKIGEIVATLEARPNIIPDFVAGVVKKTATLPWF